MASPHAHISEVLCPGCRLRLPRDGRVVCSVYFNCSDECFGLFGEVQAFQFTCPSVFDRVHQRTLDAYAVQHAGGPHPAKSVVIHLAALYAAISLNLPQGAVQQMMRRLANSGILWPSLETPKQCGELTIFDVAMVSSPEEHLRCVEAWSGLVWEAWQPHHATVRSLAEPFLSK